MAIANSVQLTGRFAPKAKVAMIKTANTAHPSSVRAHVTDFDTFNLRYRALSMDKKERVVYVTCKANRARGSVVRYFFILLAFALSFATVAPSAHAQGSTIDEQRREILSILRPIQQDLRAQILAKRAELNASTDPQERALLRDQIRLLRARLRSIATLRQAIRTGSDVQFFGEGLIVVVINRVDPNVSPS
jgi:hypothetical protein